MFILPVESLKLICLTCSETAENIKARETVLQNSYQLNSELKTPEPILTDPPDCPLTKPYKLFFLTYSISPFFSFLMTIDIILNYNIILNMEGFEERMT